MSRSGIPEMSKIIFVWHLNASTLSSNFGQTIMSFSEYFMQMAAELEAAKAAAGQQACQLADDLAAKAKELAGLQARHQAVEGELEQTKQTLEEQQDATKVQSEAAAAALLRSSELEAELAASQDKLKACDSVCSSVMHWPVSLDASKTAISQRFDIQLTPYIRTCDDGTAEAN